MRVKALSFSCFRLISPASAWQPRLVVVGWLMTPDSSWKVGESRPCGYFFWFPDGGLATSQVARPRRSATATGYTTSGPFLVVRKLGPRRLARSSPPAAWPSGDIFWRASSFSTVSLSTFPLNGSELLAAGLIQGHFF